MTPRPHINLRLAGRKGGGGTSPCDSECECMQTLFSFEDDLCGRPPVPSGNLHNDKWFLDLIGVAGIVLLDRTSGWWQLQTNQSIPPSRVTLSSGGRCFAIPPVGSQPLLYKTHVVEENAFQLDPGSSFITGLIGSGTLGPAHLLFETDGSTWKINILDETGPTVEDTEIPLSIDCMKPDVLKIVATKVALRFLINGTSFTFAPSAGMLVATFDIVTALTHGPTQNTQGVNVDLYCARMPRFCRASELEG